MNMVTMFNAHASGKDEPASKVRQENDNSTPGDNRNIVKGMHHATDIKQTPTTNQEHEAYQNKMRDLAEAAGVEGASGGRILSGAAAGSEHNVRGESKAEKKRREFTDLMLRTNAAMHTHLQNRADLMNDLADKLHDKAVKLEKRSIKRFGMAEELDDVLDRSEEEMRENGTLSKETRAALEHKITKSREELKLNPVLFNRLTNQQTIETGRDTEETSKQAAINDHEQSQDCNKTAEALGERGEALVKQLKQVKELPENERQAAYRKLFENMEDKALLDKAMEFLKDDPEVLASFEKHKIQGREVAQAAKELDKQPDIPITAASPNTDMF